jgi:hypothetical protein
MKSRGFIDQHNQLTLKGEIAKEFKFNNPLFITEFLLELNERFSNANKGQSQNSLATIDPASFVAVFSLLAEDKQNITVEMFNKFMKGVLNENEELVKSLSPIADCFNSTYNKFTEEQRKLGITDQEPQINYSYFFKNLDWVKQGLRQKPRRPINPIKEFKNILRDEEPGKTLRALERSLKLLEFMDRARASNEHFPKTLQKLTEKSLSAFRRGILDRAKVTL